MADPFHGLVSLFTRCSHFARDANLNLNTNRFMRFLVAGGVNTLFGFLTFSFFIVLGSEVWVALLACMILGVAFNYFTTGGYVFRELSLKKFTLFIICYILIYCINLGSIELLSLWISNKIFSQLLLTFPLAVLSYFIMSRFVFTKSRND